MVASSGTWATIDETRTPRQPYLPPAGRRDAITGKSMSHELRQRLFDELDRLVLIDPHTHINPHAPAATTLADVLGYHYYTELAHSAGMPKAQIEEPGLDPKEKVRRLVECLAPLDNTIQYSWLVEMARELFDFADDRVTVENW